MDKHLNYNVFTQKDVRAKMLWMYLLRFQIYIYDAKC